MTPPGNSGLDYTEGPNGEPAGRGNFRGAATTTVDIRVVKFIRFSGAKELQLMAEFFNITNRVNRGRNFERTFESASFGEWDQSGLETNQFQMQIGVRFNFGRTTLTRRLTHLVTARRCLTPALSLKEREYEGRREPPLFTEKGPAEEG